MYVYYFIFGTCICIRSCKGWECADGGIKVLYGVIVLLLRIAETTTPFKFSEPNNLFHKLGWLAPAHLTRTRNEQMSTHVARNVKKS